MFKTLLIARREYLAFVKTIGFWLSLITVPAFIIMAGAVPVLLTRTSPVQNVAVLDLTKGDLAQINGLIDAHDLNAPNTPGPALKPALPDATGSVVSSAMKKGMREKGGFHRVNLPQGFDPNMSVEAADAAAKTYMNGTKPAISNLIIAYKTEDGLHFHIWTPSGHGEELSGLLQDDLDRLQFDHMARAAGLMPDVIDNLSHAHADVQNLSPDTVKGEAGGLSKMMKSHGPQILGVVVSYLSWMTIFSSSMILLTSVIEEKSSKVIEVLLASASTDALLIGKVLGVAMVMLSVAGIWAGAGSWLVSLVAGFIPSKAIVAIMSGLGGLFTLERGLLMLAYFSMGYLMYGVTFAAIGSYCETPKDAQAVMGPIMIILFIPMLTIQAAFVSPDIPMIKYLSWIPIFTPFLMPLRLAQGLPWYEIVATLLGMVIVGGFMVRLGGRAYRQGAMGGIKLSWGTIGRVLSGRLTT